MDLTDQRGVVAASIQEAKCKDTQRVAGVGVERGRSHPSTEVTVGPSPAEHASTSLTRIGWTWTKKGCMIWSLEASHFGGYAS